MSDAPRELEPPPEPAPDVHQAYVERIRDITTARKIILPASPNADMAWRQALPITYDVVIDPPTDQVNTAQEK